MTRPMMTQTPENGSVVTYARWAEGNPNMPALQRVLVDAVLASGRPQVLLARDSGLSAKHVNQMLLGRCEGRLSAWTALLAAAGVDLTTVIPPGVPTDAPR